MNGASKWLIDIAREGPSSLKERIPGKGGLTSAHENPRQTQMRIATYPDFVEPRHSLAKVPPIHTEALAREWRIQPRLRGYLHDEITLAFRLKQKGLASRCIGVKKVTNQCHEHGLLVRGEREHRKRLGARGRWSGRRVCRAGGLH